MKFSFGEVIEVFVHENEEVINTGAAFATLVAKCSYGKAVMQLPLRGVQLFELARKLWMFSHTKTKKIKTKIEQKISFFYKFTFLEQKRSLTVRLRTLHLCVSTTSLAPSATSLY